MSPWLQEKLKDIIDAHVKEEVQEILEKRRKELQEEYKEKEEKLIERHKEKLKKIDEEFKEREAKIRLQTRIEMILELLKQKLGQLSSQTILKIEQCNDIQITILVNHIFDIQTEEQIISLLSLKNER